MTRKRPLTDRERASLCQPRDFSPGWLGGAALAAGAWFISRLIFGKFVMQMQLLTPLRKPGFFFLLLLACFLIVCWLARCCTDWVRNVLQPKRSESDSELAEIFTFAASEAIRVKEFEDEGFHYFVRLLSGEVLFLSGQYLYDYEDEIMFPCSEFDVVRTTESKVVLGLECRGTFIPPSKQLPPFSTDQFRKELVPQDLEILDIPWDEVEARYFSKKNR